jgi:DNA-binding transcriptional regulator LsrR (DeoR family)
MDMDFEEELMVKAAWHYFLEKKTQQQISVLLGVSRMRIIRLLEKAEQTGVIKFTMREDNIRRMKLERRLIEACGLKDSFVIPTPPEAAGTEINDAIAEAAAMYISSRINRDDFINFGYGDTTGKILNNLAKKADPPVSCISLTGGVSIYLPNTRFSVFNARLFLIPAPMVVSSKEMVGAIMAEPSVQEIVRMASLASFTIIGIGGMNDEATTLTSGLLSRNDFLYLKMQGAVGDILCHFFDKQGKAVVTQLEERLVSTPLETLKSLSNVIGVAAGKNKREAVKSALALGLMDIFITNEDTAQWLIENS